MTRIALVVASLGAGGAERVATILAGAWAAHGHDVVLVTLDEKVSDFHSVPPGVSRWHAVSATWGGGPSRALARVRALRDVMRQLAPGVVVSFVHATNVTTLLATLGLHVRTVICERNDPRRDPVAAPWRLARRLVYPLADALVVQTESVAKWAATRVAPHRVVVLPNPVLPPAPRRARPVALANARTIIAVGSLRRKKGFDLLLAAFAVAVRGRPGWRLVILGDGPERAALEQQAIRLGIDVDVAFLGAVADVGMFLHHADVFVLSSRHEGFPNALLEAMAHGVAPVAFACPSGPSEIIRDGVDGILVPCEDVARLAQALGRMMDDGGLRDALGESARDVLKRFSLDDIAARWTSVLEGPRDR